MSYLIKEEEEKKKKKEEEMKKIESQERERGNIIIRFITQVS